MNDLLGYLIIVILAGIFCLIVINMVYAEPFKFNMTDDLIEEERQLELCINWKIENKSCSQIYGGIDGSNGEPLQ